MFELKKHVKERLIKRTEGIISLLLIVLLVPFYSVAAILEEVGRYQSALRGLDSAISSSEMSVLAQYDQFLMDRFALLAIDQNKNIDQQFLSYLKKQDTQDTRSFSLSNAQTKATGVYPLADIEVLYQQINEFSTYTVPTKLILEGVNCCNSEEGRTSSAAVADQGSDNTHPAPFCGYRHSGCESPCHTFFHRCDAVLLR